MMKKAMTAAFLGLLATAVGSAAGDDPKQPPVRPRVPVTGPVRGTAVSIANGASWGLMLDTVNQHFPFTFGGVTDDPVVHAKLKELTGSK